MKFRLLMQVLLVAVCAAGRLRAQVEPPKRLALVISNGSYKNLPVVVPADREAALMQEALAQVGFEIQNVRNIPDAVAFVAEERKFLARISPGDICIVYFTGYAIQGQDDNYLLPVNFEPQSDKEMEERAFHLNRFQDDLEGRKAGTKILIVQGSRPIATPIRGQGPPGLLTPDLSISRETLLTFNAAVNQTAPAGTGIDPFTQAISDRLKAPGLTPTAVFESAKQQVLTVTKSAQNPFLEHNLVSSFYFREPVITQAPGRTMQNTRDRLEYVHIPAGKFRMGCVGDSGCKPQELPQHVVELTHPFWLGQTEVTAGAYSRYVDDGKSSGRRMPKAAPLWNKGWKTFDMPMAEVTWDEARGFCEWTGGRLPTEAEWEFAARGGEADQVYPMKTPEESRDKANFVGRKGNDKFDEAAPVHQFDRNGFGLYDMSGNVWEWTNDYYSPTYYKESPPKDPPGPSTGKAHVVRGGSFNSDPKEHLRLSYRDGSEKETNVIGFRCAMDKSPN
jgi:formylglycine-generating enzyme required for sulfatase activity